MISKSSFACEIGPGIIGVPTDLRFQSVQRVEADLVPEPLVEFYPDGLAVEIPVKIQHPGFHRQVAAVVDGGAGTHVGNGGIAAAVHKADTAI